MKKQNKAVGVITAILASLLSIVFVLVTFTTAVFGSVTSIVQPANLVAAVQNIDYTQVFGDISEGEPVMLGDMEVPAALVTEFMESKAVKEILSTYSEGVSALLTGKELPESITADTLRALADEHLDDLLDIVSKHVDLGVPRDELRSQIYTMIDQNAEEMVASLPTPQQLVEEMDIPTEALSTVQLVLGPTVITALIAVCVVLALLILVCRLRRFGWMLWIGIDSIIVAALVAVVGAGSGIALSVLQGTMGEAQFVVDSVAGVITGQLWLAAGILLVVGVAGIVGCCVIRSNAKKKALLAAAAEAAPVEEIAPVEEVAALETVAQPEETAEEQAPQEAE